MREILNGRIISNGTNLMDYGDGDALVSYLSLKVADNLDNPNDSTTRVLYGDKFADRSDHVGKPVRIILEVDE